ncbi:Uncharacterized protein SCF082_LOCUS37607 [Durusdinium trenchii]|uniref:Uncharacterized protein n=1 Tax=Durusdinium trenchii TaxID=1381693 RepID=A0ABP0PTU2_9DINO
MLAAKGLLQAALLFLYSGIGAVAAKEDTEKGGVKACQDTPGWSNGWSGCAWLPGGKDPALCRPTINASWPSTAGWTCEYYRQQGLCGQKDGTVKEIRQSARGSLHMWPEKNCCGCEAQDDTTCNRQTGKVCALTCGYSNGPAYCHNFSRCLCLPGHCASSDGICSLETKQDVGSKSSVPICRDTPDWTNGWSACAYEEGGRNPAWCRSTPGASWPSTLGWTCEYYRANGLCKEGKVNSWASGELHNYPEYNCCGCHKPSNTTCNRNTGGICFMGVCDKSRGPTVCVDGKCLCQEGHCGTTTGTCSLTVDSYNEPLTPEGVKEATGEATHAGISAAEAAESAGKNAAQDVQAAAKAAGQAALRSGLSAENAAEAAADAAAEAAVAAKATPQQAADAAAQWVRHQAESSGLGQHDQAEAAAKAASKAAEKAARAVFLTEEQSKYAGFASAVKAGLEAGLSTHQAEALAMSVQDFGSHDAKEKGAEKESFGPDMIQDSSSSSGSNPMTQFFSGPFLLLLLLAGLVSICYFCQRGSFARRRIVSDGSEQTRLYSSETDPEE